MKKHVYYKSAINLSRLYLDKYFVPRDAGENVCFTAFDVKTEVIDPRLTNS